LRDSKREPVVTIPPVVGLAVVRIEPLPVVVAVRAEKVRIAVRIVRSASVPPQSVKTYVDLLCCILFGI